MKLQILQNFQSVLNIFSDCPQLVKNSTSFRIILNEGTNLAELPECSKYFFNSPQLVKNSTSFRIILNEVTNLAELPECSKYFF